MQNYFPNTLHLRKNREINKYFPKENPPEHLQTQKNYLRNNEEIQIKKNFVWILEKYKKIADSKNKIPQIFLRMAKTEEKSLVL